MSAMSRARKSSGQPGPPPRRPEAWNFFLKVPFAMITLVGTVDTFVQELNASDTSKQALFEDILQENLNPNRSEAVKTAKSRKSLQQGSENRRTSKGVRRFNFSVTIVYLVGRIDGSTNSWLFSVRSTLQ
jgi:hypothetical protein